MTRYLRVIICALMLFGVSRVAAAQDRPLGLTVSTSESVGLIWRVTERVAIRPAIDFSSFSIDNDAFPGGDDDSVALQVAALFYTGEWSDLKAYVSPSIGRAWRSSDEVLDQSNIAVEGMFGLEYGLSDRFSVFGETGIRYERTTTERSLSTPTLPAPFKTTVT